MPSAPRLFRPRGLSAADQRRETDKARGSARARGYTRDWDKASARHLEEHPFCAYCALNDHVAGADLTDHLYPHRQFPGVFWIEAWWVSSCTTCHSGFKQAIEAQGKHAIDALARRLGLPVHP